MVAATALTAAALGLVESVTRLDPSDDVRVALALSAGSLAAFAAALAVAARALQRLAPRALAGTPRVREFGVGCGVWLVATLVQSAIDGIVQPHGFRLTATRETLVVAAVAVPVLLAQTLAEEFIFRGWLVRTLAAWLRRPLVAAAVQALIFGAAHVPNGRSSAIAAVTFGVAAAIVTLRTGSIGVSWGVHFANNFAGAVLVGNDTDIFAQLPALVTYRGGTDVLDLITDALSLAALVWFFVRGPGRGVAVAPTRRADDGRPLLRP